MWAQTRGYCIPLFISFLYKRIVDYSEKKDVDNALHGVKASKHRLKLSHLLFVDDIFLFSRATIDDCKTILDCLKLYEEALGETVK